MEQDFSAIQDFDFISEMVMAVSQEDNKLKGDNVFGIEQARELHREVIKFDIGQARGLHETVIRFRKILLEDRVVQNVLLNHGEELEEGKRPKSVYDVSYPDERGRNILSTYITLLKRRLKRKVKETGEYLFRTTIAIRRAEDYNAVEKVKSEEMEKRNLFFRGMREYIGVLESIFEIDNWNLVLRGMEKSRWLSLIGAREGEIQKEINGIMRGNAAIYLGRAYREAMKRLFESTEAMEKELRKYKQARSCLVSPERRERMLAKIGYKKTGYW